MYRKSLTLREKILSYAVCVKAVSVFRRVHTCNPFKYLCKVIGVIIPYQHADLSYAGIFILKRAR